MRYILRLDDIAPGQDLDALYRYAGHKRRTNTLILGVVPYNKDIQIGEDRNWSASEVAILKHISRLPLVFFAQHGTHHILLPTQSNLSSRSRLSEFNHLSDTKMEEVILRGNTFFRELGLTVDAFMPPAHGFNKRVLRSLKAIGITKIFDGERLGPYIYQDFTFFPNLQENYIKNRTVPALLTTSIHPVNGKFPFDDFLQISEKLFNSHLDAVPAKIKRTYANRLCTYAVKMKGAMR